jgi:hypothetical protein
MFLPPLRATLWGMDPQVTIPFPPDLFEALATRVAELLAERPPAQRYLDSAAAARYLGIAPKTLRTKAWREQEGVPYRQLESGRLVFDRLALDEYLASTRGAPSGGWTVARSATLPGWEGAR